MRISLFVFTLALVQAVTAFSGDKPNFSGAWLFSEEKSTLDDMGTAFLQTKMSITQSGNDFAVAKTMLSPDQEEVVGEEKLTLDGKECKSEAWGGSPRASTAKWNEKGDALTIVTMITMQWDGQTNVIDIEEEWRLGDDGKSLSIKHSSASDWGERNITIVFSKAEK